jgi:hypothetical protein
LKPFFSRISVKYFDVSNSWKLAEAENRVIDDLRELGTGLHPFGGLLLQLDQALGVDARRGRGLRARRSGPEKQR